VLNFIIDEEEEELEEETKEPVPLVDVPLYVKNAFDEFKIKFDKNYEGEEHDHRLQVFYDNLKYIEDFYRSGPHSFTLGIN
jgi:hypothetical protein